jgi:hypothetical protein
MAIDQCLSHSSLSNLSTLTAEQLDDYVELMDTVRHLCEFYCEGGSHPIFLDSAARARRAIERCEKLRRLRARKNIVWW